MGQLEFGQPIGGIIQMAYVVPDIRVAMAQWTADLRVGPWFFLDHFTGDDPVYRGRAVPRRRGPGDGLRRTPADRTDSAHR